MKVNIFTECMKNYGNKWGPTDDAERFEVHQEFPYSVIVEGDVLEYTMAVNWSSSEFGVQGLTWKETWYGKTNYDYGFSEFFFKTKEYATKFENAVPTFYAEEVPGKKWRTEGYGNIKQLH